MGAQLKMNILFKNSYFKDSAFEADPIKYFLKRYDFASTFNKSTYYYMLLSKNQVELHDSPLLDTVKTEYSIDTRIEYSSIMEIPDGTGSTNAYISAYVMMDDTQRNTVRRVNTYPMVFSDTGGFMTFIFLITVIIVERL